MKATEARELAKEANTIQDLNEVYEAIKRASGRGDYETTIYLFLTDRQQSELEKNGYKLTVSGDKVEPVSITISWKL